MSKEDYLKDLQYKLERAEKFNELIESYRLKGELFWNRYSLYFLEKNGFHFKDGMEMLKAANSVKNNIQNISCEIKHVQKMTDSEFLKYRIKENAWDMLGFALDTISGAIPTQVSGRIYSVEDTPRTWGCYFVFLLFGLIFCILFFSASK